MRQVFMFGGHPRSDYVPNFCRRLPGTDDAGRGASSAGVVQGDAGVEAVGGQPRTRKASRAWSAHVCQSTVECGVVSARADPSHLRAIPSKTHGAPILCTDCDGSRGSLTGGRS